MKLRRLLVLLPLIAFSEVGTFANTNVPPGGPYEEIKVRGQKIKVTLNGTKILDVDCDTFDRSQIAHPPKGLDHRKGHLGFAGHNDPVEFRSFQVKRLN
jgi:hypothetical protein